MLAAPFIAQDVRRELELAGYSFTPAETTRALLGEPDALCGWQRFADSWSTLPLDQYLARVGQRRRRRHAIYSVASNGEMERQPPGPHYQSVDYNRLQGGIERWFDPISEDIGGCEPLLAILRLASSVFSPMSRHVQLWHVEVHQFRIEARQFEPGEPTPEGIHRDGVDFVLVVMINRDNVAQGTTTIHRPQGALIGAFTLEQPLDAAWVVDARVHHGVTPVEAIDPTKPAFRDVLIVTFRASLS